MGEDTQVAAEGVEETINTVQEQEKLKEIPVPKSKAEERVIGTTTFTLPPGEFLKSVPPENPHTTARVLWHIDMPGYRFLKELNGGSVAGYSGPKIEEPVFELLIDRLEKAVRTDKSSNKEVKPTCADMESQLAASVPDGAASVIKVVYGWWERRRKELAMPLVRELRPPPDPADEEIQFVAFRPREEEGARKMRTNNKKTFAMMEKLRDEFRRLQQICELIKRRERLKLAFHQAAGEYTEAAHRTITHRLARARAGGAANFDDFDDEPQRKPSHKKQDDRHRSDRSHKRPSAMPQKFVPESDGRPIRAPRGRDRDRDRDRARGAGAGRGYEYEVVDERRERERERARMRAPSGRRRRWRTSTPRRRRTARWCSPSTPPSATTTSGCCPATSAESATSAPPPPPPPPPPRSPPPRAPACAARRRARRRPPPRPPPRAPPRRRRRPPQRRRCPPARRRRTCAGRSASSASGAGGAAGGAGRSRASPRRPRALRSPRRRRRRAGVRAVPPSAGRLQGERVARAALVGAAHRPPVQARPPRGPPQRRRGVAPERAAAHRPRRRAPLRLRLDPQIRQRRRAEAAAARAARRAARRRRADADVVGRRPSATAPAAEAPAPPAAAPLSAAAPANGACRRCACGPQAQSGRAAADLNAATLAHFRAAPLS